MKHINTYKVFESDSNKYYEVISDVEWHAMYDKIGHSNFIEITPVELRRVKDAGMNLVIKSTGTYKYYLYNENNEDDILKCDEIYKVDNEFFFLFERIHSRYKRIFKCDQVEGLIKCIKDNFS